MLPDLQHASHDVRFGGLPDHSPVCGIDEAGRGPLAGPVVAAAILLPEGFDTSGIADSKKLTAATRERLFERLYESDALIGVGFVEAEEIDRINILRATHEAMRRALNALPIRPARVRVDGLPVPNLHDNCENLIGGDSLCTTIAAASIIAKVTRDRLMCQKYHEQYPQYNFAGHKGYGTPEHLRALSEHGACPIHRRSFAPVARTIVALSEVK